MVLRIGISALIETLKEEDSENIPKAIPQLLPLLKNQDAIPRGDAAYLLGVIGHTYAIPYLKQAVNDEHADVRIIAEEAIAEIRSKLQTS